MQPTTTTEFSPAAPDFYAERKYCAHCDGYQHYLASVTRSFCVECGGEVQLLSQADRALLERRIEAGRPKKKSGRPRKQDAAARRSA